MSVVSAREALLEALNRGVTPSIEAGEVLLEEVNDFMLLVNDYDEWDATKDRWQHTADRDTPDLMSEPAITVKKLRRMLGYGEVK